MFVGSPAGLPRRLISPGEAVFVCRSWLFLKAGDLWLELEYTLAKGRVLPGIGESCGAAGVEQGWRGRGTAPPSGSFLLQGKGQWLGFSPKLGYYGSHCW